MHVILSEAKDHTDEDWITQKTENISSAHVRSLTPFGMTIVACMNSSKFPQRAKMRRQFRRFGFDEIGFYVLNNPIPHRGGQKIDNRRVNFGRRGKRPAFLSIKGNNLCNLIGELFLNAAIGFGCKLGTLRDGICVTPARAVAHREAPGQIAQLIHQSSMRIGDVECLN
jgi:hypothetical protein